jgi:uncharacterized protein
MGKFLVLILVVLAVVFIARVLAAPRRERDESGGPPRVGKEELVVPCAHCGIHVPESAAVRSGGRVFCSDDHRRLFGK